MPNLQNSCFMTNLLLWLVEIKILGYLELIVCFCVNFFPVCMCKREKNTDFGKNMDIISGNSKHWVNSTIYCVCFCLSERKSYAHTDTKQTIYFTWPYTRNSMQVCGHEIWSDSSEFSTH